MIKKPKGSKQKGSRNFQIFKIYQQYDVLTRFNIHPINVDQTCWPCHRPDGESEATPLPRGQPLPNWAVGIVAPKTYWKQRFWIIANKEYPARAKEILSHYFSAVRILSQNFQAEKILSHYFQAEQILSQNFSGCHIVNWKRVEKTRSESEFSGQENSESLFFRRRKFWVRIFRRRTFWVRIFQAEKILSQNFPAENILSQNFQTENILSQSVLKEKWFRRKTSESESMAVVGSLFSLRRLITQGFFTKSVKELLANVMM